MGKIKAILAQTNHRSWQPPAAPWAFYQQWNNALFLHWKLEPGMVQPLIPVGTVLDTIGGHAWLSLVAFSMEKVRPKGLPSLSFVSDFHEINVRTYVKHGDKAGVYFINIEAEKELSAFLSRNISGMPYEKAVVKRTSKDSFHNYTSTNNKKGFNLDSEYSVGQPISHKSALDSWLTERYCAYVARRRKLYRFDLHHPEWPLFEVELKKLKTEYHFGNISLDTPPDLAHYSNGVEVLAWKRELLVV